MGVSCSSFPAERYGRIAMVCRGVLSDLSLSVWDVGRGRRLGTLTVPAEFFGVTDCVLLEDRRLCCAGDFGLAIWEWSRPFSPNGRTIMVGELPRLADVVAPFARQIVLRSDGQMIARYPHQIVVYQLPTKTRRAHEAQVMTPPSPAHRLHHNNDTPAAAAAAMAAAATNSNNSQLGRPIADGLGATGFITRSAAAIAANALDDPSSLVGSRRTSMSGSASSATTMHNNTNGIGLPPGTPISAGAAAAVAAVAASNASAGASTRLVRRMTIRLPPSHDDDPTPTEYLYAFVNAHHIVVSTDEGFGISTIRVWRIADAYKVATMDNRSETRLRVLCGLPSGDRIAGGFEGGEVAIWSASSGRLLCSLLPPSGGNEGESVCCMLMPSDGALAQLLVTGSADLRTRIGMYLARCLTIFHYIDTISQI
jgi:hypothetical protein